MSKPRHDWHGHAVSQIRKYPDKLMQEKSIQSGLWYKAIRETFEETEKKKDGDLIVQAVKLRYMDNRYKLEGVARTIGVSETTVRRWTNGFVNRVGEKAGY